MKKIVILFLFLLVLCGCSSPKNPQMDEYFKEWISNYQFVDNTLIKLSSKDNKNDIEVIANSDLALVSTKNGDEIIDHYYQGKTQYFYIKHNGHNAYYRVDTEEKAFEKAKDLYTSIVFDPSNVSNVSFVETKNVDGISCDIVKAKISKDTVTIFFNHLDGSIIKIDYKKGASLVFSNSSLELPIEFDDAMETTAEVVNGFMDEFANLSK